MAESDLKTTFVKAGSASKESKSHFNHESEKKVKKQPLAVATPDISQMTPFKPTYHWYPGQHRIPGGVFPLPPLAADLCSKLPPPQCFEGPYVILDNLLRTLCNANLEAPAHDNGNNVVVKEEPNNHQNSNKRKLSKDLSDNEDDNEVPTNDLYRKRQQRRIK